MSVLDIKNISIDFPTSRGVVHAVTDVTLSVPQGRRIGFIGESGSGKTTTALAAMRMLAAPGFVSQGEIHLNSLGKTDLLKPERRRDAPRAPAQDRYIPQGAMNSLNPVMRIEHQIWDGIVAHEGASPRKSLKRRSDVALEGVGLDPNRRGATLSARAVGRHETAGLHRHRRLPRPRPDHRRRADQRAGRHHPAPCHADPARGAGQDRCGLILIGHDMGLMAQSVDDIAVLKKGELVEFGPTRQIIEDPQHPYTKGADLLGAAGGRRELSQPGGSRDTPASAGGDAACWNSRACRNVYGAVTALHPMSFASTATVPQIISIVGQSGSGKSTMGSLMLGFNPPTTGEVLFKGRTSIASPRPRKLAFRKDVQAVFQDPYACFNPFYRVNHALKFPFERFG
jgi:peptide/nickel transport system ATP-binding protein